MLEILEKHLNAEPAGCVVAKWINGLKPEEQQAFDNIKKNNQEIHIAALFKDLYSQSHLPFKLTAFRSHLRGYCTCQK
jgi:hypothetical protein